MAIKSRTLQKNIKEELNDQTVSMREISGMGIQQQEEVSDSDLMNLINTTNKVNIQSANSTINEIERLKQEEYEKEKLEEEKERKQILKEKYEKEKALREKKEEEERLEEERLRQLEEEKKKKSIINKLSNMLKTRPVKKNDSTDNKDINETLDSNIIDDSSEITTDALSIDSDDITLSDVDDSEMDVQSFLDDISTSVQNDLSDDLNNNNNNNDDDSLNDLFYSETEDTSELSETELESKDTINSNDLSQPEDINFALEIENNDIVEEKIDSSNISPVMETPLPENDKKTKKKEKPSINININIGNPFRKKEKQKKDTSNNEEIERLKFAAYNDDMTGLLNKKSYKEKIESIKKVKAGLTVIYFDVNNLKLTNDTIGHEAGDSLISEAAGQIKDKFPEEGYRTGGDEFIVISDKYKETDIKQKIDDIHSYLNKLTKENSQNIRYAVSIGYAIAKKNSDFEELMSLAEEQMYTNKKAYKEALKKELGNKYVDPRASDKELLNTEIHTDQLTDEQYDNLLTKDQRDLKQKIQYQHEPANKQSIAQIIAQIQSKSREIEAILIADKNFNNLFILQDINSFIRIVQKMELNLDFTYLYVLFKGGPQYFGIDEYTSEITHLFENISAALLKRQIKEASDLQKIKGINIFKQIHADF